MHQRQRLFGSGKACFVGHRVGGFIAGHAGNLAFHVAVFGNDHAAVRPAQHFYGGMGHLPGGLARGCQNHPPSRGKALQCAAHRFIRQHGVNTGSYNRFSLGTQGGIHGKDSFL